MLHMHAYAYMYIHVYVYVHTHVPSSTGLAQLSMHLSMHISIQMPIHMSIHMSTHMSTHMFVSWLHRARARCASRSRAAGCGGQSDRMERGGKA